MTDFVVGFLKSPNKNFTGFLKPIFCWGKYFTLDYNLKTDRPRKGFKLIPDYLLNNEYYQPLDELGQEIVHRQTKVSIIKSVFIFQLSLSEKNKIYIVGDRNFTISFLERVFHYNHIMKLLSPSIKYELSLFLSFSVKAFEYKKEIEASKKIKLDSPFSRLDKKNLKFGNVIFDYLEHLLSEKKRIFSYYLIREKKESIKDCIAIDEKNIFIGFFKMRKKVFVSEVLKHQRVKKHLNNSYSLGIYVLLLFHLNQSFKDILLILETLEIRSFYFNNYPPELDYLLKKEKKEVDFNNYFNRFELHRPLNIKNGAKILNKDYKIERTIQELVS